MIQPSLLTSPPWFYHPFILHHADPLIHSHVTTLIFPSIRSSPCWPTLPFSLHHVDPPIYTHLSTLTQLSLFNSSLLTYCFLLYSPFWSIHPFAPCRIDPPILSATHHVDPTIHSHLSMLIYPSILTSPRKSTHPFWSYHVDHSFSQFIIFDQPLRPHFTILIHLSIFHFTTLTHPSILISLLLTYPSILTDLRWLKRWLNHSLAPHHVDSNIQSILIIHLQDEAKFWPTALFHLTVPNPPPYVYSLYSPVNN
jgi:hypothetical protein